MYNSSLDVFVNVVRMTYLHRSYLRNVLNLLISHSPSHPKTSNRAATRPSYSIAFILTKVVNTGTGNKLVTGVFLSELPLNTFKTSTI